MVLKTMELGCGAAVDLIKLVIALRFKTRKELPTGRSISRLLFLVLYTDEKGALTAPKFSLPVKFTIYLKGPYVPVDRLIRRCGVKDVVKIGASSYFIKGGVDAVIKEAAESLTTRGLGELVEKTRRVIEIYGRLDDEELSKRALEVLGLDENTKTLFFNVSLEAFIRIRETLRMIYSSGTYEKEEELFPGLWD